MLRSWTNERVKSNCLDNFWLTVDCLYDLKQLTKTVEVFTREMFNDFLNLCICLLFIISIINHLILDDEDFVSCCVISEIKHAPLGDEAAFP